MDVGYLTAIDLSEPASPRLCLPSAARAPSPASRPGACATRPPRLPSCALPSPFSLSEPCFLRVRTSLLQPLRHSHPPSLWRAAEKKITYFLAPHTARGEQGNFNLNYEGNRAHPGRPVWQPDRCQGKEFKPLNFFFLFFFERKKNPDKLWRMVLDCLQSPSLVKIFQKQVLYIQYTFVDRFCFWKMGNYFPWQSHFGESYQKHTWDLEGKKTEILQGFYLKGIS